jgi:hypothetical protein
MAVMRVVDPTVSCSTQMLSRPPMAATGIDPSAVGTSPIGGAMTCQCSSRSGLEFLAPVSKFQALCRLWRQWADQRLAGGERGIATCDGEARLAAVDLRNMTRYLCGRIATIS